MEARGSLLNEDSYAPPVYDEAAGVRPQETQKGPAGHGMVGPQASRQGVSRGTGDSYVALGAEDVEVERHDRNAARANDIAMRRQQEHAAAFQRQMRAEEDFARSSAQQTERDAEIAARLAAGHDEGLAMEAIRQQQLDAEIAARMQRDMQVHAPIRPIQRRKIVRVLVPNGAKAGDSLAVSTPSTGKFEVRVPAWAPVGSHFDCQVTTTVEVKRPGQARSAVNTNPLRYQPPTLGTEEEPQLPPGWERAVNSEGATFYINHNDRTTHWEPPVTSASTNHTPQIDPHQTSISTSTPQQPSGMTEEEMIAEAIARSLQDSGATATTSEEQAQETTDTSQTSNNAAAPNESAEEPNLLDLDVPASPPKDEEAPTAVATNDLML